MAALTSLLLSATACQQQNYATNHQNALISTWRVVSVDWKNLQESDSDVLWKITDQEIIVTADGQEISRRTYHTDTSHTPNHLDMKMSDPTEQERLGIYKVWGDRLWVTLARKGNPRPIGWPDEIDDDVIVLERLSAAKP